MIEKYTCSEKISDIEWDIQQRIFAIIFTQLKFKMIKFQHICIDLGKQNTAYILDPNITVLFETNNKLHGISVSDPHNNFSYSTIRKSKNYKRSSFR